MRKLALPLLLTAACAPEDEEPVNFPDAHVDGEVIDNDGTSTELISGLAWTDGDYDSLVVALTTYEVACSTEGDAGDWLGGDSGLVVRLIVEGASAGGAVLRQSGGSLAEEASVDHSLSLTSDPSQGDDAVDGSGNFLPGLGASTGWSGSATFSVPWCGEDH